MSALVNLARSLGLLAPLKRVYRATVDPLLSALLTFERKRIEQRLSERMDVLFQALDRKQSEQTAELLRLRELLERCDVASTRVELDDLKREVTELVEALLRRKSA